MRAFDPARPFIHPLAQHDNARPPQDNAERIADLPPDEVCRRGICSHDLAPGVRLSDLGLDFGQDEA